MTIVTNFSDLSPLMRELLLRPAEPDLPAETGSLHQTARALFYRGLVDLGCDPEGTYRLSEAGKRCRRALEQQAHASGKPTEDHPLTEALDLIESLIDSADDCRLNIIGDCLSHDWSFVAGEVCPVQRAKDFLAKYSRR